MQRFNWNTNNTYLTNNIDGFSNPWEDHFSRLRAINDIPGIPGANSGYNVVDDNQHPPPHISDNPISKDGSLDLPSSNDDTDSGNSKDNDTETNEVIGEDAVYSEHEPTPIEEGVNMKPRVFPVIGMVTAAVIGTAVGAAANYGMNTITASSTDVVLDKYHENMSAIVDHYKSGHLSTRPGERYAAQWNFQIDSLKAQTEFEKGKIWTFLGSGQHNMNSDFEGDHMNYQVNNGYVFK